MNYKGVVFILKAKHCSLKIMEFQLFLGFSYMSTFNFSTRLKVDVKCKFQQQQGKFPSFKCT